MLNNVALWDEIRTQSYDEILAVLSGVIDANMNDDGDTYGNHQISRGERIVRFQADAAAGALDIFAEQSPELFRKYVNDFLADMAQVLEVRDGH